MTVASSPWPPLFADLETVAAAPACKTADIRPPVGKKTTIAPAATHAAYPAELGPALLVCLGANRDLLYSDSFDSPEISVLQLQDALLVGGHHHVITQDRRLLEESLYLSSAGEVFQRIHGARRAPARKSSAPLLLTANAGHANHYHWLVQCLPSLVFAEFSGQSTSPIPVLPPLSRRQEQSLRLAGYETTDCLILGDELVEAETLYYPSLLSGHTAFTPWLGIADFGRALAKRLPADATDSDLLRPRLIYLSRFDTKQRVLVNEEELATALQALGFAIVTLGSLDLYDQIRTIVAADIIVAPHGAALTSMMFMKPGAEIVELVQEGFVNPCFFRLSQACRHRYAGELFPCEDDNDNVHARSWHVDVPVVLTMAERAIRRWEEVQDDGVGA